MKNKYLFKMPSNGANSDTTDLGVIIPESRSFDTFLTC